VVFDEVDTNAARFGEAFSGEPLGEAGHSNSVFRAGKDTAQVARPREHTCRLLPEMGAGIPRDSDVLQIVRAAVFNAESRGGSRETGPVLDPVKAFFFNCGHKLAVNQRRGRGIAVKSVKTEDMHYSIACLSAVA
jgi:hypothetical protein